MWLYAYEAVTQNFLHGATDDFITSEPYFCLLRAKRIQFFDVLRGHNSIQSTLRDLRNENLRLRRMREAIQDDNSGELNLLDEDEDASDLTDDY